MARLSVAVLGPPEVCHGQRPLVFPTRKALAILIYLLVEGGSHPREKLTALFWPDSDQEAGRATLRSTLARLREGLAGPPDESHLVVERDGVAFAFATDFELDLHLLQSAYDLAHTLGGTERPSDGTLITRLQAGADAWRGEFLEGFSLRDSPDFDDWAGLQREVWRRRTEEVLDRLSLLYAESGANTSGIQTVNRWLFLNPLDERAHRRLMRLHFAAGDRAAALRAYEACRTVLGKELDVRPDPETEALAEHLRAAPTPPGVSPERRAPPAPALLDGPFVGRADEFTKLVEHFHAAARGHPRAIILQGEAGIGKTRLATEFLAWAAAQGADVLPARAFEAGARLPYQPLVDALRPRLERETSPDALLSDVWLVELSRLLPELRDRYPDLPLPTGDEASARTRLFEALARLGRALAKRAPTVLFIDDVQWADNASLDVLRYAGRRWAQDEAPVLLLVCLRAEALAMTPALDEWQLGLRRDLPVTQIDLGPLTFDDTLRLLHGPWSGPTAPPGLADFARWIFAETSGQPFFVLETLRTLLERGTLAPRRREDGAWAIDVVRLPAPGTPHALLPAGVQRFIHARLAPLTPIARELLAAAAVLGQGFSFELLCGVGRLSDEDALPALDEVLRGYLLREAGAADGPSGAARYLFTHDKIRDVVYAEAGDARRRVFHRRALEALEAAAAPAAELARHALAAGLDEPALRHSVAAGDEAMRLLAARDAAAHYERALALAERLGRRDLLAELHARRGHAFVSVAMWANARRELEIALAGLGADEQARRAEILADLAQACWWKFDVPALQRHATEVLVVSDQVGRGDLETEAMAWLGAADGSAGNVASCVEQTRRAIARARSLGIAPPANAGNYESMSLYWLGRLDEAIESGRAAVDTAQDANHIQWTILSLPQLGLSLAATGRYAEAERVFAEARRLGREFVMDNFLARTIAMSAGFRLDLFDFAGAEAVAQESRDLARSANFPPPAISAGIDLLLNYARRQEVGRTEKLVDEVAAAAEQTAGFHGWLWRLRLAEARAEIALARRDWDDALRWAADAIEQSRARGRVKYEVLGLASRAQALLSLGRANEAVADLNIAVALARPVGDPALFLRAVARLLTIDGDDALVAEARAAVARITAALPDAEMRRSFELAEAVRLISKTISTEPATEA